MASTVATKATAIRAICQAAASPSVNTPAPRKLKVAMARTSCSHGARWRQAIPKATDAVATASETKAINIAQPYTPKASSLMS